MTVLTNKYICQKDCPNRSAYCRKDCEQYKKFRELNEEIRKKQREEAFRNDITYTCVVASINRRRKKG